MCIRAYDTTHNIHIHIYICTYVYRKSKLYGSGTGPLQYRSRPGRDTVCQGKGRFGKLGGGSHVVLFMVPLGPLGARPMAQALQLPFEYYTYIYRGFCTAIR